MRLISDLAVLYLAMAQTTDEPLGTAELEAVTDTLRRHFPDLERAEVQSLVLESLTEHLDRAALRASARQVVRTLGEGFAPHQKTAILHDLERIAQADGLILDPERELLEAIAEAWRLPHAPAEPAEAPAAGEDDGALHHLAFIYLVLAHGTDRELSDDERQLILKKLQEWRPELRAEQVQAVLSRATERYAHGASPERLAESVEAVRRALPEPQRKAAFDDLIQLANADGVFLDSEEDLLNDLRAAWEIADHAGYGTDPGAKDSS